MFFISFNCVIKNTLLHDNPHATPIDISNTNKPNPIKDKVTEGELLRNITPVASDFDMVDNIRCFLSFFIRFSVLVLGRGKNFLIYDN